MRNGPGDTMSPLEHNRGCPKVPVKRTQLTAYKEWLLLVLGRPVDVSKAFVTNRVGRVDARFLLRRSAVVAVGRIVEHIGPRIE